MKNLTIGMALMLALGMSGTAGAAPGVGQVADLKATANEASVVEKAYWAVRCSWHRGHRNCHRVWVRPHRFQHYRRWR